MTARSEVRARLADQLAVDMVGYLLAEVFPHLELNDDGVWEGMDPPDREIMEALAAYERGEIEYADLEAAGTRYVEAWQAIAAGAQAGA